MNCPYASAETSKLTGTRYRSPAGNTGIGRVATVSTNWAGNVSFLAARRHGEDHLAPVCCVRCPHDQAALFENRDDPGHGGRLHLFVLGELARGHRAVAHQGGQGGQLRVGKIGLQPERDALGSEPAREPTHRDPERCGQADIRPGLR